MEESAGTGKSRLIEEFKAAVDSNGIQWREGHAYPYTQNIPYFPLINLMSRAFKIEEGDSPEGIREKIEKGLEFLANKKDAFVPYVGSLYSLKYPEIEEVSPEFWKMQVQKAMHQVLSGLAQRAPTVVCLEDLHWADPSTLELVRFLLSETGLPVIFIATCRPIITLLSDHQINNLSKSYSEIPLQDLSSSETLDMVESLLKTDNIPSALKRFVQDKVEGNPFYLEEAINSLIESNILVSENGDWKVIGPITDTEISATIHGLIAARIDRLSRESKKMLQEASVIGRSFYYEILKRMLKPYGWKLELVYFNSKLTYHIDCVLSLLEEGLMAHPKGDDVFWTPLPDEFKDWEVIDIDLNDHYEGAENNEPLGGKRIVMPKGTKKFVKDLERRGWDCIEVDYSTIWHKFHSGIHCSTASIWRET